MPIRILVLAAHPAHRAGLALGKESREIKAAIRAAKYHDAVALRFEWAVRPADVLMLLDEYRPQVVHFYGHGGPDECLMLEDDDGDAKPVSADALAEMFRVAGHGVRLVVFNLCYSLNLARALSEHVDCTIGVKGFLGDRAAVVFSACLYRAIASGNSVSDAFEQARASITAEGLPMDSPPMLRTRTSQHGGSANAHGQVLLHRGSSIHVGDGLRAVPDPPPHYLPREDALAAVERMVLAGAAGKVGISAVGTRSGCFGVYGLGGIGKSVLAAAVARSDGIQERFPDGVLWLTVGQEPELTTLQAQIARALGYNEVFRSAGEGHRRLRELFAERAVLLVLDDVWELGHAEKLDVVGDHGRLLVTTRNREVLTALGASEYSLDVLAMEQTRVLLARWAGCDLVALPDEAEPVAALCGRLPLALAMIGAMLREGAAWRDVREALEQADVEEIAHRVQDYPHESMLRTMEVSVQALPPELRERYVDLAVFGEDESIPVSALAVLWGTSERKARSRLGKLASRSLVMRDDTGQTHLHDLQRMYVRARAGNLAARHGALVDAYASKCPEGLARGPAGAVDAYFFRRLPMHLLAADREPMLHELLWSYDWFDAKLRAAGVAELIADFERIECDKELALVRDALRLSSHVLGKDVDQLPTQLIGRLGYFAASQPRIRAFLSQVHTQPRRAWLCPMRPTLTPPGGPLLRTFEGHGGGVTAVALSPDGKRALSGSDDGMVKLWDVKSGEELRTFGGLKPQAIGSVEQRVIGSMEQWDWDVDSVEELWDFEYHGRKINAVVLSADGKRAMSGSDDWSIELWDVESGEELRACEGYGRGNVIVLSADGKRALSASGSLHKSMTLWDVESGAELRTFEGHLNQLNAVALSADGKRALSGSGAWHGTMRLWDVESGEELRTFEGHMGGVNAVALSGEGKQALSGSNDRTVKLWDVESGEELRRFEGHGDRVNAVALSGDGKLALSGSNDRTVKLWDTEGGEELRMFERHGDRVNTVSVSADGKRALSGSNDGIVKLWDVESGEELRKLVSRRGGVWSVAISGDGKLALAGSSDGTVKLWDTESGEKLRTLVGHVGGVCTVALSGDGKLALSGSRDGTVKLWDVESGEELRTLVGGHTGGVNAVALSGDGRRALAGDKTIRLWDVESGEKLRTLKGHTGGVSAVALSADGKRALSGSDDGNVKLWDVGSGNELRTFAGHAGWVGAVALSGDGKRALSGSEDRTVKVWDIDSSQTIFTFTNDTLIVACALSSTQPAVVIAGDVAGRVHFLRLIEPA